MKSLHWGSLLIGVALVMLVQFVLTKKKAAA